MPNITDVRRDSAENEQSAAKKRARDEATIRAIDHFEKSAKKNVALNLYNLRTKVLERVLGISSQAAMAEYLGNLHKGTYCKWENQNDPTLPGYGEIANIQLILSQKDQTKSLAKFSIDSFYNEKIDFEALCSQEVNPNYKPFLGSYIAYYYDFSEVRVNQLELSRLRMNYVVVYFYEKPSFSGGSELCAYAAKFKRLEEAEQAWSSIENKCSTCDKIKIPEVLETHLKVELAMSDNDIYTGDVLLSKDSPRCLQLSLSNKTQQDYASMLFIVPVSFASTDEYLGGLGSVNSVSKGINHRPIAQKIIISHYPLQYDEARIGNHLCVKGSDLPLDNRVKEIIASYEALKNNTAAFGLSEDDLSHIVAYKLKNLVDTYNSQLNLTGFQITKEEDNEVFHLIKHFSIQKIKKGRPTYEHIRGSR